MAMIIEMDDAFGHAGAAVSNQPVSLAGIRPELAAPRRSKSTASSVHEPAPLWRGKFKKQTLLTVRRVPEGDRGRSCQYRLAGQDQQGGQHRFTGQQLPEQVVR